MLIYNNPLKVTISFSTLCAHFHFVTFNLNNTPFTYNLLLSSSFSPYLLDILVNLTLFCLIKILFVYLQLVIIRYKIWKQKKS